MEKGHVHFFIDFENVHENGFKGIEKMSTGDEVTIFVSQRANKMNINLLALLNKKGCSYNIKYVKSMAKNSMDFQVIAGFAYEIGKEKNKKNTYVIISKDKHYTHIVEEFQEHAKVSQNKSIYEYYEEIEIKEEGKVNNSINRGKLIDKSSVCIEKKITQTCKDLSLDEKNIIMIKKLMEESFTTNEFHNNIRRNFHAEIYRNIYVSLKEIYKEYINLPVAN